jgi:hypothetical protein
MAMGAAGMLLPGDTVRASSTMPVALEVRLYDSRFDLAKSWNDRCALLGQGCLDIRQLDVIRLWRESLATHYLGGGQLQGLTTYSHWYLLQHSARAAGNGHFSHRIIAEDAGTLIRWWIYRG